MKIITKLLYVFTLVLFFQFSATAQDSEASNKELGISFSSLNSFGLVYKVERKNGSYLRFDATSVNLGVTDQFENINAGLSTRITLEKRKELSDKVFINHGFGLGLAGNISHAMDPSRTNIAVTPSIHYLLGLQYRLSDRAYVGIEVSPSLAGSLSYNSDTEDFRYAMNLRASTNANLGFMYQF